MTSLDVIHSFWAYQLGVKADANPGVDNVAYTTPKQTGRFTVRCNELCGIWHGAMYQLRPRGDTTTAFAGLGSATPQAERPATASCAALPPYSLTYDPTVVPQLGHAIVKVGGITGADGYYYPPQDPVTAMTGRSAADAATPTTVAMKR